MAVKAQYVGRVGVLAVALGIGAAVANTPGVAFAEPTDSSSSSSSSNSSSSRLIPRRLRVRHQNPQQVRHQRVRRRQRIRRPQRLAPPQVRRLGLCRVRLTAKPVRPHSPSDASTADPRSGIVQSSGGAHTSSTPSSSDATASAGATPTQTQVSAAAPRLHPPSHRPPGWPPSNQSQRCPPSNRPRRNPPQSRCHRSRHRKPRRYRGRAHRRIGHRIPRAATRQTVPDRRVRHRRTGSQRWPPGRCDPRVDRSTAHRDRSSGGVAGQHLFGRRRRCC